MTSASWGLQDRSRNSSVTRLLADRRASLDRPPNADSIAEDRAEVDAAVELRHGRDGADERAVMLEEDARRHGCRIDLEDRPRAPARAGDQAFQHPRAARVHSGEERLARAPRQIVGVAAGVSDD